MRHLLVAIALLASTARAEEPGSAPRKVDIKVTDAGFVPREVKLKTGQPVTLVFTRTTDQTCITAIDIPSQGVQELKLPLNKPASVTVTPKKAGVEPFHCSAMGMGNGKLLISD